MLRENPFEIYANLSCIGFIFSPLVIFLKFFTVDSQCENGPDIALILDVSGIVNDIDLWMVRYFVKAVTGQIFNLCPKLNTAIVSFGEEAFPKYSVYLNFPKHWIFLRLYKATEQ